MILVTVGTQFPFDRLLKYVSAALEAGTISEEVVAQVGSRGFRPAGMDCYDLMTRPELFQALRRSRAVIGHAGIGTILSALDEGRPLLVVPRRSQYKEVVNDHQLESARRFERSGYLLAAETQEEFLQKMRELSTFSPPSRTNRIAGLVEAIRAAVPRARRLEGAKTERVLEEPA